MFSLSAYPSVEAYSMHLFGFCNKRMRNIIYNKYSDTMKQITIRIQKLYRLCMHVTGNILVGYVLSGYDNLKNNEK